MFLQKEDNSAKTVRVMLRIRKMNDSERLHWLHRVKSYNIHKDNN